jgi:hypothetical protein
VTGTNVLLRPVGAKTLPDKTFITPARRLHNFFTSFDYHQIIKIDFSAENGKIIGDAR